MPISLAVCFVVAFFILIGARRMRGVYFGILTMALVYLVQNLFSILPYTGGAEGILLQRLTASMDPHLAEIAYYESTLIYLILVVFATGFIVRSKLGKGIISIREDEDVAEMRGVNTVYVKAVSYGVSAALSGAAGNLYAYFAGYIDPSSAFGFVFSINVLLMVLLGGMGTRYGPLLGAFIFIMLSEVLRYSIPSTFEGLHVIIFGSLIVIFTVFAPSGLMGVLSRMMKKKRVAKSSAG
jgi:branched-chain amino acid transport system permease protein